MRHEPSKIINAIDEAVFNRQGLRVRVRHFTYRMPLIDVLKRRSCIQIRSTENSGIESVCWLGRSRCFGFDAVIANCGRIESLASDDPEFLQCLIDHGDDVEMMLRRGRHARPRVDQQLFDALGLERLVDREIVGEAACIALSCIVLTGRHFLGEPAVDPILDCGSVETPSSGRTAKSTGVPDADPVAA